MVQSSGGVGKYEGRWKTRHCRQTGLETPTQIAEAQKLASERKSICQSDCLSSGGKIIYPNRHATITEAECRTAGWSSEAGAWIAREALHEPVDDVIINAGWLYDTRWCRKKNFANFRANVGPVWRPPGWEKIEHENAPERLCVKGDDYRALLDDEHCAKDSAKHFER